jgi:hypothetical protein
MAIIAAACSEATGPSAVEIPADPDATCATTAPIRLGIGGVASYSGTSSGVLCLDGGAAGVEYLVVASNAATTATSRVPLRALAKGVEAPQYALTLQSAAARVAVEPWIDLQTHAGDAFHYRLRRTEREELTPLMERARTDLRAAQAGLRTLALPDVGTLLDFNVNHRSACTNPDMRAGRVMAVSERAIVVADTANPANGFGRRLPVARHERSTRSWRRW